MPHPYIEMEEKGLSKDKNIKSTIFEFTLKLRKDGYSSHTIKNYTSFLKLLVNKGVNIFDGEAVKLLLADESWKTGTKSAYIIAYTKFAQTYNIKWIPPLYQTVQKIPFIPLESEIDSLIAACGKKTATVLQLLKETGMRIGEALDLEWIDIDFEKKILRVNRPEKHGKARALKISEKLCSMLLRLKRKHSKIFGPNTHGCSTNFYCQRKRIAEKLGNPRILQIHFHTLRHWKATTEYQQTKDLLHVMTILGHKNINTTLLYTHMIEFEQSDNYHSAVAKNMEEAQKLVESGFDYVTEFEGIKLFRKRK